MDFKLKPIEHSILQTADAAGHITIPPGTAMEIDECVSVLLRLQKKGIVGRHKDAPYYSPFHLTEKGRELLAALAGHSPSDSKSPQA